MADSLVVQTCNLHLKSDRGADLFRGLDFTLESGKSVVISGPAGSGKTLLAELFVGLRFPASGSVTVLGRILRRGANRKIEQVRRKIGGVGGIFGLVPSFTAAENIMYPLVLTGVRRKVRRERLMKMLAEFSLLKQASEYPRTLTRVESTLVQLARASVANQPLMIIDEPSAGLDVATSERVFKHLVNASLSGRSMIILASERPPHTIPNTDYLQIANGELV
ncbi:MAG: ATP-binding cassette domain-containing protein [Candidatus Zixiibacteriota bacterium]